MASIEIEEEKMEVNFTNQPRVVVSREEDGHTYVLGLMGIGGVEPTTADSVADRWWCYPTNADGTCDFAGGTLVSELDWGLRRRDAGKLRPKDQLLLWLERMENLLFHRGLPPSRWRR